MISPAAVWNSPTRQLNYGLRSYSKPGLGPSPFTGTVISQTLSFTSSRESVVGHHFKAVSNPENAKGGDTSWDISSPLKLPNTAMSTAATTEHYVLEWHGEFTLDMPTMPWLHTGKRYHRREIFVVNSFEEIVTKIDGRPIDTLEIVGHGVAEELTTSSGVSRGASMTVGSSIERLKVPKSKLINGQLPHPGGKKYDLEQGKLVDHPIGAPVIAGDWAIDLVDGDKLLQGMDEGVSWIPVLQQLNFTSRGQLWIGGCSVGRDPDFVRAMSLACGVPVRAGVSHQLAQVFGMAQGFEGTTILCNGADCVLQEPSSLIGDAFDSISDLFQSTDVPDLPKRKAGSSGRRPKAGGMKRAPGPVR